MKSVQRELTRNQRALESEARIAALWEETVRHRAAISGIEKFIEKWSARVNAEIAWLQLPWWKRTWLRIEQWWRWWWNRHDRRRRG